MTIGGFNADFIMWEQSFNCGRDRGIFELMARNAYWYYYNPHLSIYLSITIIIIIIYHNPLLSLSSLSSSALSPYIYLPIYLIIIGMVPLYITWRPVVIFLPVVQNQKNHFQEFMKIGRRNRSNYERTKTNDVI